MTLLKFPRPLEGSSRERWRSTSTEESLVEESVGFPSRGILSVADYSHEPGAARI